MSEKYEGSVRVFSALEFANICGVVNQTALNWIRNGFVKAFPTSGGQFRLYAEDIRDFLVSRGEVVPEEIIEVINDSSQIPSTLIVDDDIDLNNGIKNALTLVYPGMEIFQAFDGFDAGRLATEKKPRLIILDLNLPGVDGFKLLEVFKTNPNYGMPYVLVTTGKDDQLTRIQAHDLHADQYLPKPTTIEKIQKAILNVRKKPYREANLPVSRFFNRDQR